MASYTSNLNLKKPAGSENVSIGDINNNMDLIDQAYGEMDSSITDMVPSKLFSINNTYSFDIGVGNNGRHLLAITGANSSQRALVLMVSASASGVINVAEVYKSTSSGAATYTIGTNKITVTQNNDGMNYIADFKLNGSFITVSEA